MRRWRSIARKRRSDDGYEPSGVAEKMREPGVTEADAPALVRLARDTGCRD